MIRTRLVGYAVLWSLIQVLPASGQEAILQKGAIHVTAGETPGKARPDTGLADPTVNPGQASGMRVVRGEVKQASPKTIVIEDSKGKETTMSVDAGTLEIEMCAQAILLRGLSQAKVERSPFIRKWLLNGDHT